MLIYHYKKIQAGMRCHCFVEDPEDVDICRICYNVGIRGGYEYATLPRISSYELREEDHNIIGFQADLAHFIVPEDVLVLQKNGNGVPYKVVKVESSSIVGEPLKPKHLTVPATSWTVVAREVPKTDPVYVFCVDWAAV
jgi:hypothetical protein